MIYRRTCAYGECEATFETLRKAKRYCSISCASKDTTISSPDEIRQYLLERTPRDMPDDVCWIWQGVANKTTGYGQAYVDKKRLKAHRLVYEIFVGPIPHGLHVLHSRQCISRLCVNPNHLRCGTNKENMEDKIAMGHQPRGSTHYMAALTEIKVAHILRWRYERNMTYEALAEYHGVDIVTIHDIIQRKTWTHVLPGQYPAPEGDARYTLTEDDVRTMRRLHADDGWTYAALGRHFHIDQVHVRRICLRRSWKHLD